MGGSMSRVSAIMRVFAAFLAFFLVFGFAALATLYLLDQARQQRAELAQRERLVQPIPAREAVQHLIPAREEAQPIDAFCPDDESMCSTITTDNPADALAKIAAALPKGRVKRYRVKVSVAPLED